MALKFIKYIFFILPFAKFYAWDVVFLFFVMCCWCWVFMCTLHCVCQLVSCDLEFSINIKAFLLHYLYESHVKYIWYVVFIGFNCVKYVVGFVRKSDTQYIWFSLLFVWVESILWLSSYSQVLFRVKFLILCNFWGERVTEEKR